MKGRTAARRLLGYAHVAPVFSRPLSTSRSRHAPLYSGGDSLPEMPPCDVTPQPYKGPSFDETRRIRKTNINPALTHYYKTPLLVNQGHMQWLFDHTGRRYLDLFAGIVTVSVGHCHPKVQRALSDQTSLLWHTTNIYLHPRVHEYAEKLTATLPEHLNTVYFVNSGSEANDLAIMMARLYTGRHDVIGLRNAYHGGSPYVLPLLAHSPWRYSLPTNNAIHQTMNPDVYRGPWGGAGCRDSPVQVSNRECCALSGHCTAEDMYVEQLEDVLRHCTPKAGVAAFFAEAIQGVGGTVQYPKRYLQRAFEAVRARGGLCVSDEVQTGFGRTGTHFWGFEGHGVQPDIVTMAKGMGNGFPMAAVVTTREVGAAMGGAVHFNTFGGNPMAGAVGSAVLDALEEDNCQQTSHTMGTYLLHKLAKLREECPLVGDVRGKGLMIGVEMVADKATRAPLPPGRVADIWERTKDMGVLLGKGGLYGSVFRIKPPMCITTADVDFAIAVIRKALDEHLESSG